ncbi:hypothetical protein DL96DRAFT_1532808 [Flagelloscypha sp. PMI_526]|nr:hypothetical protein DL96DRAFT_1532808 [Flagelloscypha sp. PMI_526]
MTSALAHLTLFPATYSQARESRLRTHPDWSRGVTKEAYLRRDDYLATLDVAKDGKLTVWVLAPRNDPETLDFLCSCESYKRPAILKTSSSELENVTGYGIASVYTPSQNRGKGYAKYMMRLLHWVLGGTTLSSSDISFPNDLWGEPPNIPQGHGEASFSVLYSDVGSFYHNCGPLPSSEPGWVSTRNSSTVWSFSQDDSSDQEKSKDDSWILVRDDKVLEDIWTKDALLITDTVSKVTSSKPIISFLPFQGVAQFQHARLSELLLLRPQLNDFPWGIVDSSDNEIFATWTIEFGQFEPYSMSIVLTRLRCPPSRFASLLAKVKGAAGLFGMSEVEVWNLDSELAAEVEGGRTFERDEHLSCIAVYRNELKGEMEWEFNER